MNSATNTFNAFEIFEIAEQIERNGAKFYSKAAQSITDPKVRQTLLNLAAMEEEHEKIFADMRNKLLYKERQITPFQPLSEIAQYLRALADSHVFDLKKDLSRRLTGRQTIPDIIEIALTAEKDSIVFYLGLKNLIAPEAGAEKVDAIIREEMNHISSLTRHLEK